MPSSLQQAAPGSKSAKFISTNPLDPILKPFEDTNDSRDNTATVLAERVHQRLLLSNNNNNNNNSTPRSKVSPTSVTTPISTVITEKAPTKPSQEGEGEEDWDSLLEQDDDDDKEEKDIALEEIRTRRLAQLKFQHELKSKRLALGYGQYRTISQDEFLPECILPQTNNNNTSSTSLPFPTSVVVVVIHFAHDEFERCKIMDRHLHSLATLYYPWQCKFLRILAPKAPFFAQKFAIQTLPTLLVFCDGLYVTRLTGFEGLLDSHDHHYSSSSSSSHSFPTWRLAEWLAQQVPQAMEFPGPLGEEQNVEDEHKHQSTRKKGFVYKTNTFPDEEEDI